MTPEEYVEARAELLVDVSDVVATKGSAYTARWVELLDNPDMRSDLIIEDAVGYLQERDAEEGGDESSSAAYAQQLLDYTELTWREIHEVPPAVRGDLWHTARKLVACICQAQASAELIGAEVLTIGDRMGKLTAEAGEMSRGKKETASTLGTTKRIVAEKAAARKATVTTEG